MTEKPPAIPQSASSSGATSWAFSTQVVIESAAHPEHVILGDCLDVLPLDAHAASRPTCSAFEAEASLW